MIRHELYNLNPAHSGHVLVASEMIVYIPVSVLHSSLNDDTITILYHKVLGNGDIVKLCREIVPPWSLSIYLQKSISAIGGHYMCADITDSVSAGELRRYISKEY